MEILSFIVMLCQQTYQPQPLFPVPFQYKTKGLIRKRFQTNPLSKMRLTSQKDVSSSRAI